MIPHLPKLAKPWPQNPQHTLLILRVQPGASKSQWDGFFGDQAIKIRLKARPIEGAANQALREFLSETFSLRQSDVQLISGETNRNKQVVVARPPQVVLEILRAHLQ